MKKLSNIQIPILSLLIKYGRYFNKYIGLHLYVLIFLSMILALTEGFGITLFFPLLAALIPGNPGAAAINSKFQMVFDHLGLALTTTNILLVITTIFVIKAIGLMLAGIYQYHLGSKVTKIIRKNILDKLPTINYQYYLQKDTGYLTNIISLETARMTDAFVSYVRIYSFIAPVVVFTVIVFSINQYLAFYVIILGMIILISFRIINLRIQHYSIGITGENSNLSNSFIQFFQAFKYLYSTAGFNKIKSKLDATNDLLARLNFKIGVATSISGAIMEPITIIAIISVMFFQINIIQQSTAALLVTLVLLQRVVTAIFNFQGQWQIINYYMGSVNLITDVIGEIENNQVELDGLEFKVVNKLIEFKNVTFGYNDKQIISNANILLYKNQMLGFIGQSGAGKSTLINLITGIIKPTGGMIAIDGVNLSKINKISFREKIGYVTQETVMFNDTIANNISLWSCDTHNYNCMEKLVLAAKKSLCLDFIVELPEGFNTQIGDRGIRLSGGQRQRLAIARELFKEPEILIFDEATSSLDSETETYIINGIEKLKGNITIILISHRISTIKNCDKIYYIKNGRVVEEGNYSELRLNLESEFNKLCNIQNI